MGLFPHGFLLSQPLVKVVDNVIVFERKFLLEVDLTGITFIISYRICLKFRCLLLFFNDSVRFNLLILLVFCFYEIIVLNIHLMCCLTFGNKQKSQLAQ